MAGVNKTILVGHLGRPPEFATTKTGARMAKLRVATGESWRDKATGERKDRTEWHWVLIYNENLVSVAERLLKKGSHVYIEGQSCTREWIDREGVKRWITEVVLRPYRGELAVLDPAEQAPPPDPDDYGTTRTRSSGTDPAAGGVDDEIPFG